MDQQITVFSMPSNQGMGDLITCEVTEVSSDLRLVRITLSVNGHEYVISSNEIECSIKETSTIMDVISTLFGH